jgi:Ni/Co efflux regulator RcnB
MRRSVTAILLVATALAALLSSAETANAAAAGTVSDRGWACPDNRVVANAPFMTSLNGGFQNVHWAPVVQKWVNGQWTTYRSYIYESGAATASGSGSWAWSSGQPSYGKYTTTVDPGYWYGGRYYPTYYRVVDYYQWADLNNNAITGWGSFVSGYAYCSY